MKIGPKEAESRALRESRVTAKQLAVTVPTAAPAIVTQVNRNVTRGHRKRVHATNAERQRAYRQRKGA